MDRKKLGGRIRIARDAIHFSRKKLCEDIQFDKYLFFTGEDELNKRQLDFIERGDLKNTERISNIITALCNRINISKSSFYDTDSDEEFERLVVVAWEGNSNYSSLVDSVKSEIDENLIEVADVLLLDFQAESDRPVVERLFEIAHELSKEDHSLTCAMKALSIYRAVIGMELYPELFLESILKTIRMVANNCYENMNECPDKMDKRGKPDDINRSLCESLIRLISRYNSKFNFNSKIKLEGLDLRRLFLLNRHGDHDINSLKGASFKGSNIAYTVLSSIDLSETSFDNLVCAKNAWFAGADTILHNASFKNANLVGVNIDYDDHNGKQFVGKGDLRLIECGWPFLNAKSLSSAKIDPWLKSFIESPKGSL